MLNFKLIPIEGVSEGYFAGEDGFIYSTKKQDIPKKLSYGKSGKIIM